MKRERESERQTTAVAITTVIPYHHHHHHRHMRSFDVIDSFVCFFFFCIFVINFEEKKNSLVLNGCTYVFYI